MKLVMLTAAGMVFNLKMKNKSIWRGPLIGRVEELGKARKSFQTAAVSYSALKRSHAILMTLSSNGFLHLHRIR